MRSVAIMLVLLVNGDPLMRRNFPDFPRFWFMDGVDLFFVLSGYLIGRILIDTFEKNGFSLPSIRRFWRFRWFRTLPNYYLILFATLLFVYVRDGETRGFDWRYLFFLQNLTAPIPPFFTVSWSLVVEEWFYVTFPMLAYCVSAMVSRITARQAVLATTLLFIFVPLLLRTWTVFSHASTSDLDDLTAIFNYELQFRSVAIYRPDSIAFGVLGAYVSRYHPISWRRYAVHCFTIGLSFYLIHRKFFDYGVVRFTLGFTVSSFSLSLLLPLASTLRTAPRAIAAPITHLSVVSYSAYLIHRTLVMDAFRAFGGRPFTDVQAIVYYFLYFIITILLSTWIYRFFEAPITGLRERRHISISRLFYPSLTDSGGQGIRSVRKVTSNPDRSLDPKP